MNIPTNFRLVVIESPYAGDTATNLRFLRACLAHSLSLGEAPFASHGIYPQEGVLDDKVPEQRALGIGAGFAWGECAHLRVFYTNLGWSSGMDAGLEEAIRLGQKVEHRTLPGWISVAPPKKETRSILVVDDNEALRESIAGLLADRGWRVTSVPGASGALDVARCWTPPNVMLTDVRMGPGADGVWLAQHFASAHPDTRTIVMSGASEELARARGLGFEVIAKPFDGEELIRVLG